GRRFAFAGDEASGLPFILGGTEALTADPGETVALSVHLLEGIDPLEVYAQIVPPDLDLSTAITTLDRIPLTRTGPNSWTWSATIPAPNEPGEHTLVFHADYSDGEETKPSEPHFGSLTVLSNNALLGDVNGDGLVTPADAMLAFECWLNGICPVGGSSLAANVCDPASTGITPTDAQAIFGLYMGLSPVCAGELGVGDRRLAPEISHFGVGTASPWRHP
ncbi:MAG: hypothetical protein KF858_08595, partial [Candidatus Sumerlaeia bacterium]|nr:hypothetical protein [Candidatus Sumerlaeia bacterium]